jgi:hypothetical protein
MSGRIRYKVNRAEFRKAWKKNKGNISAVARDLKVSRNAVCLRVDKWRYKKINTRIRKRYFNEHYLDQIDDNRKGFWLGYLFGNSHLELRDDRAHGVTVTTNRQPQLLYDLVDDLEGTHDLDSTAALYLISNHFAEVLADHGKGYKWKSKEPPTVYPEIDDDYQVDFIHGWIRGNSSCRLDNRTDKRVLSISSREPGVLANIKDYLGIGGSLKERSTKNGWELVYGGPRQVAHIESLGIELPSEDFCKARREMRRAR